MPIDPNIALGYNPGSQLQSPMNMMAQIQALQNARQENAMRQAQMANYNSEIERRNALLPAELAAARSKAQSEELGRKKNEHELAVAELDRHMDHVALVNNQAGWTAWRNGLVSKDPSYATYIPEEFTPENKVSALSTAKFVREQLAKDLETTNVSLGGTTEGITRTGKTMWTRKETATPGELLTDARERQHQRAMENIAAAKGGELTPLQQQKLRKSKAEDKSNYSLAVSTADSLEGIADELLGNPEKKIKAHPGLPAITGLREKLYTVPGTDAASAEQRLETFKGKVMALGRQIATEHGKLGNMAVQEWKFVSDAVQKLDPSAPNFNKQLRDVVTDAKSVASRIRTKYEDTYDEPLNVGGATASKGWGEATVVTKGP